MTARATVIVTQRERFGMTEESLSSLLEHTPDTPIVYVDGNSPKPIAEYLENRAAEGAIRLVRKKTYLTPNQARNIGISHASSEYVAFVDNDVVFTEGWLDALVTAADETGADIVAPLTCHGLPFHTEIHHAGGDYAAGGDVSGFFEANDARPYEEVMHGHGQKVVDYAGKLRRMETGMCEFHCVLARRDVFDRFGPLDEAFLSTKEHIDFSMTVRRGGGKIVFEPSSVVTYVFPNRARPITVQDWPFFALRWSDAYGRRTLRHFIEKWQLKTPPNYILEKRGVYAMRRMQGILIPLMRKVPFLGKSEGFTRTAARATLGIERVLSDTRIWLRDRSRTRG